MEKGSTEIRSNGRMVDRETDKQTDGEKDRRTGILTYIHPVRKRWRLRKKHR